MANDDSSPRGPAISDERRALANLSLAHAALAVDIGELALDFDRLSGDARRSRLFAIAERLARLGDKEHETRHALRELALSNG